MDMAGNVWEIVTGTYKADYSDNTPTPYVTANGFPIGMTRGGSRFSGRYDVRSTNRTAVSLEFDLGSHYGGFRCVLSETQ